MTIFSNIILHTLPLLVFSVCLFGFWFWGFFFNSKRKECGGYATETFLLERPGDPHLEDTLSHQQSQPGSGEGKVLHVIKARVCS